MLVSLGGCALYDKEYIAINDYVMPTPGSQQSSDKVTVSNLIELKNAIQGLVNNGVEHGTIVFSDSYSGEPSQDISDACWQVRSQDALCAFCVANISYDLSKIVSYYEANVSVTYAKTGVEFGDIRQITFTSGLDDLVEDTLENHDSKLVVLVGSCAYSAENVASLFEKCYFKNPLLCPKQPKTAVRLYSGTGYQKLYDVSINYGLSDDNMNKQMLELQEFNPFKVKYYDDSSRLKALVGYLAENCTLSDQDSVYSALIEKNGNSKALALSTVVLCDKLNLDCLIVNGQKNYEDHFWNIIKIDKDYYHFDPSSFLENPGEIIPLRNDSDMWNEYRWDTSVYPKCNGNLQLTNDAS